jgi:hypothetical protein
VAGRQQATAAERRLAGGVAVDEIGVATGLCYLVECDSI